MPLEPGDVILVRFPHADQTSPKQRPALVLTPGTYNARHRDVVAAFMTSRRQRGTWSIPVPEAKLASGRLVRPTWIRADRLATIDRRLVRKLVARIDPGTLQRVRRMLVTLLAPDT